MKTVDGQWTAAEDLLLLEFQARLGNKWTQISHHLPGKNASQCSQRWRHKQTLATKNNIRQTSERCRRSQQPVVQPSRPKVVKSKARSRKQPSETDVKQTRAGRATRSVAAGARPSLSRSPTVLMPDVSTSSCSQSLSTSSSSLPAGWPAEEVNGPGLRTDPKLGAGSCGAHRSKGVFVCGHRRIYFSTGLRTTTYKRRSPILAPASPCCSGQNPDEQAHAMVAKHIPPDSTLALNLNTAAPAAKTVPAAHLLFASPPFTASYSQLHSVQTGLHVKRLAPDSCKPDAAGMRALPALDPCGLQPQHLQLADDPAPSNGKHDQQEGRGESVVPSSAAILGPLPLSGGALGSLPGDKAVLNGTPRSRTCTPRSTSTVNLPSLPAVPAGNVVAWQPLQSPPEGAGTAAAAGPASGGTRLPQLAPAEPGALSPSMSQSVSDWSNAPSVSWSSWVKKGYTINVLGADAESSRDPEVGKASRPHDLGLAQGGGPAHPYRLQLPPDQDMPEQGPAAFSAVLEDPGRPAGPGRQNNLALPRIPSETGRQRRASDPYPSGHGDGAHIHQESSPLKKVCLNSPDRLSPQDSSPGLQRGASLQQPGLLGPQGRAWGVHRSGYKCLLSILDSAPSEPLAASRTFNSPCPKGSPLSSRMAGRPDQEHRRAVSLSSPPGEFKVQPSDRQVPEAIPMPAFGLGAAAIAGPGGQSSPVQQQAVQMPAHQDAPGPAADPPTNQPSPPVAPPPLNQSAAQAFRLRRLAANLFAGGALPFIDLNP